MSYDHWFDLFNEEQDLGTIKGQPIRVKGRVASVTIDGIIYSTDGVGISCQQVDPSLPMTEKDFLAHRNVHWNGIGHSLKKFAREMNGMPPITERLYTTVPFKPRPWWESQRQARLIRPLERIEPLQGGTIVKHVDIQPRSTQTRIRWYRRHGFGYKQARAV